MGGLLLGKTMFCPHPRRSAGCFDAPGWRSGRWSAAQFDLGELGTILRPEGGWVGDLLLGKPWVLMGKSLENPLVI